MLICFANPVCVFKLACNIYAVCAREVYYKTKLSCSYFSDYLQVLKPMCLSEVRIAEIQSF